MATLGNWRNAAGTQNPPLFTSVDNTHQVGVSINVTDWQVTVLKRTFATNNQTTFNLGSVPALVTYGITPVKSDATGGDVHYGICCALDDRNRMWIAGNSLAETPHLIRSAPNVINSWTTFTFPYPGFGSTGGAYCTYNHFMRLSDGRLIFQIDQRDVGGPAEGKDNLAYILPLGSDTWQPLVSTGNPGEFLTSEPASGPQRVYLGGCFVENYPHKDRVWISGTYRHDWTDVTTQLNMFCIYNDTVTDQNTWKRIDGTSQPMPVSYSNIIGSAAIVPLLTSGTYWYTTGMMSVDRQGNPHFINSPGGVSKHIYWDGSAWQVANISSSSTTPSIFTIANGNVLMYREFGGRLRVSKTTAGANPTFDMGYPIPTNWDQPYPDPIQLSNGKLHMLITDGDNPTVFTFGDHTSAAAS